MLWQKLMGANPPIPIEYVGGFTSGFEGTTSGFFVSLNGTLSGGIASSPSVGDLVIVYFATGSTQDRNLVIGSSPATYTELVELYANGTFDTNLAVAYRELTGGLTGDLSNFAIVAGTVNPADAGAVAVQVWRNVGAFDVTQTTATATNSVLCNPPAITPITPGAVIVSGGAGAHSAGAQTFSSSDLTGFMSVGSNDTNDVTIGLGHQLWTSGAFDPAQFTFSASDSTSFSWAAVTLALRPV